MTVVVPAYNASRFLADTLQSAVTQTYANVSIVVIDDGSTDDTRDIALGFASRYPDLRVISTPNGGVAAARNRGTEEADGRFVAYLDADDLWHPTKLEKQVAALAACPAGSGWTSCYALYRQIDSDGLLICNGPEDQPSGDLFAAHLLHNCVGNGSNLMVERDAALAVGGFDSAFAQRGLGGVEDLDFQLKLLETGKMAAIHEYLVGYRCYPGNMSSAHRAMGLGLVKVIDTHSHNAKVPAKLGRRARTDARGAAIARLAKVRDWRTIARLLAEMAWSDPAGTLPALARRIEQSLVKVGLERRRGTPPAFASLDPRKS